ncbi:FUSC family protein [Flavobacterium sp. F-380]|uniref:FUSC family protein n=1 Tax=Flavobacterium kayseriense TaxID=2764714 RepID=A0ABR7J9R4_9FLAO|nr:FUSC family membrane protein [Flavobacterium kayseriense]MBC5842245.1 FUSC family protein [Flavobacterium kayseriense]MBC5848775.1 FUSC family protein [Flavobacterium kayseriense]MBU0940546.1 FUSC family protein [Bacteroidota bacterium]
MITNIKNFIDSTHFTNALKVTFSAVIPALLFSYLGYFSTGFTIALGAILTYPSDIPSSLKHKVNGMLVAAFTVAGMNLIINFIHPYPLLFYPVLVFLIFLMSMISVYGQRATMVSFSGLLAISLAFANLHSGWEMLRHSGLLLTGGLFYLLISLLFYYIRPNRYIQLQIAQGILLTAKYLKLRGDLWKLNSDRKEITKKQLHFQVELNAIHENIREVLIRNRTNIGSSNQNRKMLITFISLVEIMELAIATSFDHNKLHQKFDAHPKVLETYQNLAYKLAACLKKVGKSIEDRTKYTSKHNLLTELQKLEIAITDYEKQLDKGESTEGVLMLINMLHYAEKQVEKIKTIERAFIENIQANEFKGRDKDLEKFISPNTYLWNTLIENLSFSSTVFRHSSRLTITILIGFIIGQVLPFQNTYWILLTIVVIMRPGYGLTNQRTYQRIFGTLLGGAIAFGVLLFINNTAITAALAILAMLLGFTYTPSNYKIGATFVTIYVVFIYAILTPNITDVVQYRILDTCVGALLAFLANSFIWPSWEFLNLSKFISKAISANRNYLNQISILYNKKGEVTTAYRLARKEAFVDIGNLMASFQRMIQEPKSKQSKLQQVYKLTVVNHSLLSSLASLGTYIQSHKTTQASEAFNEVVNAVLKNLDSAILLLDNKVSTVMNPELIDESLKKRFIELNKIREREIKSNALEDEADFKLKMQEAQLVIEQLIWLTSLSENILKITKTLLAEKKESQ